MKSKSFVTDGPLLIAQKRELKFGEVLAESYWSEKKPGFYKESEPRTSEILNKWFFCLHDSQIQVAPNGKIYLFNWYTGIRLEVIESPDGVIIERLTFKPDAESNNPETMKKAVSFMRLQYLSRFAVKPFLIANNP